MSIEDQLEIAAAAREELEALHGEFMASVRSLKEPKVNGAEFRSADGEMEVTCLGIELQAKHRLVARKGQLDLIEYAFLVKDHEEELPIWSIYLSPTRRLYSDASLGIRCAI